MSLEKKDISKIRLKQKLHRFVEHQNIILMYPKGVFVWVGYDWLILIKFGGFVQKLRRMQLFGKA